MSTTLNQIFEKDPKGSPYKKPVAVVVCGISGIINYRKESGEERQMVTLGLADNTLAVKGLLYDLDKLKVITEGSTILIINCITKADPIKTIVITRHTKVSKTRALEITDSLKAQACAIVNPPPAGKKTITEAKSSPVKTLSTVQGQIISEEMIRTVEVKGQTTPIKDLIVREGGTKCKVTLWRDLTEVKTTIGAWVELTNMQTQVYKDEISLSSTSKTTMKEIDNPQEKIEGEIIGYSHADADSVLLLLKIYDEYPEYAINSSLLGKHFQCDVEELDDTLPEKLPHKCVLYIQNGEILKLQ